MDTQQNKKENDKKYRDKNKEIQKEQKKKNREKKKELIKQKKKEYYEKNNKKIIQKQKEYYEENNETINKKRREFYEENNETINEKRREYYEENTETINEKRREYYEENKQLILNRNKDYRDNNKDKINDKKTEYYKENKEQIAEKAKEYYQENKEQIIEKIKEYAKCRSCKLFQTNKTTNYLCSYCNPDIPTYIKTREVEIKIFLEENNYQFEYNKFCKYQDKGYFPDFKIKSTNGNFWIIIECDERAHKDYDKKDEKERENNICLGLNVPCIFIRYNPDRKGINMKIKQKVLKSYIEYYKNKTICDNEVNYLFY